MVIVQHTAKDWNCGAEGNILEKVPEAKPTDVFFTSLPLSLLIIINWLFGL